MKNLVFLIMILNSGVLSAQECNIDLRALAQPDLMIGLSGNPDDLSVFDLPVKADDNKCTQGTIELSDDGDALQVINAKANCTAVIGNSQPFHQDGLPEQTPPGNIPGIFAPGIISLNNRFETYPTFSPDGNEMFFSVVNANWSQGKILYSIKQNGNWTEPDTAIFSNNNYKNWESFISPDGTRQFFASNRPPSTNMDIWMVERTSDSTWSDPVRLENPVNSNAEDGSACVVNNGTLYFKSLRGGGVGGSWLYRSPLTNGFYSQVESLGNLINTGPQETEPFMAPDESYLIFTSYTRPGYEGWDLWISYRNNDSTWTEPINMGPNINTADDEYGPRVSLGGDFLFFTRENVGLTMDIYWVSSGIIDSLKNIVLSTNHPSLEQKIQLYPNPVNDTFKILFGNLLYKNASIRLMDIEGKIILSDTCHNLPAITIDLREKPKGLYILQLDVDGEVLNKKIVH